MLLVELRYRYGIRAALLSLFHDYNYIGYASTCHELCIYKADSLVEYPFKQRHLVKRLFKCKYPSQFIVLPILITLKPVSIHRYRISDSCVHVLYTIKDSGLEDLTSNEWEILHAYLPEVMKEEELLDYFYYIPNWKEVERIWLTKLKQILLEKL